MQLLSVQFGFTGSQVLKRELTIVSKDDDVVIVGKEPHCRFVEIRLTKEQAEQLANELESFVKNLQKS